MALVMSMLVLVILSSLIIAFSVLSSTEPTIANNQLRVAQARALAESGVERAVWALTVGKTVSPAPSGSLASPLPVTVPAPYDGSLLVGVLSGSNSIGGFRVTVTADASDSHQRLVSAVGWTPTDDGTDTRTKAHQKITATLMDFPSLTSMPCAVCVRGDIQIGGTSTIDSRADTSCGARYGTWSTTVKDSSGTTISPGNTTIGSGSSKIYGAVDGNNLYNQATDMAVRQDQADFDKNALTNSSLDLLKSYAKAQGTYYRGTTTTPTVAVSTSNKLPSCGTPGCIVFVDTISGNDIIAGTTPTSDYAQVTITGAASVDPTGFHGWIVANGSLSISGNFNMTGLAYAVNDLAYVGTGGSIVGQLISANIRDTIATVIDTSLSGVAAVTYNCAATTGPISAIVPKGFVIKPGTYKEVSD
jgi:hypothetical protein